MSKIDDMIKKLCPNGVEYKTLESVSLPVASISWAKNAGKVFKYIDLSSVDIATHAIVATKDIDSTNAPSRAQQIVRKEDILFATTRPTQMRVCNVSQEYDSQICSTGFCVLRVNQEKVLPNWVLHVLSTKDFQSFLSANQVQGNYPSISNKMLKSFSIPVPPLPIQEEIVRILDSFTKLEAELEAELEARRQQYEFYRDKLLSFNELHIGQPGG